MKSLSLCCITLIVLSTAVNSCVLDGYDDSFSGTSWRSDEVPLGPFEVSGLILEFQGDGRVTVCLEMDEGAVEVLGGCVTLSGEFSVDGETAVLHDLNVTLGATIESVVESLDVTFIEAHLSGKTLFLLWRVENAVYPFTTALHHPAF